MKKIILFVLVVNHSFAQSNFAYKEIPDTLTTRYQFSSNNFHVVKEFFFKQGVNITNYLPEGYSKEGDVDYTSFLQDGINENDRIIMPNFPVLINPEGLHFKSNTKILFQSHSKLIINPNPKSNYHGILIDNVENIDLYYPKIVGDKYKHQTEIGQWGMGILVKHSQNIRIYNPNVSKCWGDGIYIGNNKNIPSSNIKIYNAFLDDNRRNGISITCGKDILIEHPLISNNNGHNPRSGIDIEPNTNKDIIENIRINSPITYNNGMHGIVLSVGNLAGELKKSISITINNHIDYFSTIGLGLAMTRKNLQYPNEIGGVISINNSLFYKNSHSAIKTYKGKSHHVQLQLKGLKAKDDKSLRQKENSFIKSFNQNAKAIIKDL